MQGELPLVLLFEVPPVTSTDRANLWSNRYTVRGTEVEFVPPVDWRMDPYENLNWRFWFHAMQHLDVPLRIYEQDTDLHALGKARDLMLDWVSDNPDRGGANRRLRLARHERRDPSGLPGLHLARVPADRSARIRAGDRADECAARARALALR